MMFKKREKNTTNLLKRTYEDREETADLPTPVQTQDDSSKRVKHTHDNCSHKPHHSLLKASTKTQQLLRQGYIHTEVQELSSFRPDAHNKISNQDNATAHLEIDTERDKDAFAHARANIEISRGLQEGALNPNVYRGEHGYQNYIQQSEETLRAKRFAGTLGPVRAPTFIRNTTRVDYNPERCKDWYETGRCNFGDSCVFIHDRSDYKSGWQLDQEFEAEQKRKQLKLMGHDIDDGEENYEIHSQGEEEGEPTTCRICEQPFTMPVVTQCGHYFCERCALQHYSSSSTCFVCSKNTNGIFNEVPKKFAQKQQKEVQQEESEGDQGSDEGDEITTRVGASSIAVINKRGVESEDSEENGILSKADREVFEEYQNKKKEVDRKKYASQTGWFIP